MADKTKKLDYSAFRALLSKAVRSSAVDKNGRLTLITTSGKLTVYGAPFVSMLKTAGVTVPDGDNAAADLERLTILGTHINAAYAEQPDDARTWDIVPQSGIAVATPEKLAAMKATAEAKAKAARATADAVKRASATIAFERELSAMGEVIQ